MMTLNPKNRYRLELVEKYNGRENHPMDNSHREGYASLTTYSDRGTFLIVAGMGTSFIKSVTELPDGVTFIIKTNNSMYKLTDLGVASNDQKN